MADETITDVARRQAAHVVQEIKAADFTPSWRELRWLAERLAVAARHMEAVEGDGQVVLPDR